MMKLTQLFDNWQSLNSIEKFDRIISVSEVIKYTQGEELTITLVEDVLRKIESLRYELAHNKATESNSGKLDRILAITALTVAARVYKGPQLEKFIDGVNYYESNEVVKTIYKKLVE